VFSEFVTGSPWIVHYAVIYEMVSGIYNNPQGHSLRQNVRTVFDTSYSMASICVPKPRID